MIFLFAAFFIGKNHVWENLPNDEYLDRIQSMSGDWSGNLSDFYFRVYPKLVMDEIYELVNSSAEGITTFSLNREYTVDVQDYESLNSFSFFICSFHSSEEYGPSCILLEIYLSFSSNSAHVFK